MNADALFCSLSPVRVADLVRRAQYAVCYAAPGIQLDLARAMVEAAARFGKEMLTVSLDFDDRVMRMGYGDIGAAKLLLESGIAVQSSPGLRTALIVGQHAQLHHHGGCRAAQVVRQPNAVIGRLTG